VRFRLAPSATNCGIDWFRTLLIRNCSIFKDQFFLARLPGENYHITFHLVFQLVFLSIYLVFPKKTRESQTTRYRSILLRQQTKRPIQTGITKYICHKWG
ncbi:hypothetical protein, partial [Heliomicrobium gestii]|uniref:hypothetical protein n=1 Tax=Heliomicrobium gestii TaxID=2699 RepID=UPI00195E8347